MKNKVNNRAEMTESLTGIGSKSREMLEAAGITSLSQLNAMGSVDAYLLVKRAGCEPSLNFLWGLEALLSDEHWLEVARNRRLELLMALEDAEERHNGTR